VKRNKNKSPNQRGKKTLLEKEETRKSAIYKQSSESKEKTRERRTKTAK